MFSKTVVVFAVLMLLMVSGSPMPKPANTQSTTTIIQEEPCVLQGGLCMLLEDCEPGNLAHLQALCPMQRHRGVECCYVDPTST